VSDLSDADDFLMEGIRLEAIVDGGVPDDELSDAERRLVQLLSDASGPATARELLGQDAAVASFVALYAAHAPLTAEPSSGVPEVPESSRPLRPAARRGLTATSVAVGAVLLSGVAAAAQTGQLPAPIQHVAHQAWGAPDRHPRLLGASGAASGKGHQAASDHASTGASSAPSGSAAAPGPAPSPSTTNPSSRVSPGPGPSAGTAGRSGIGLCRAWTAQAGQVNPQSALGRALSALAGGPGQVGTYCGDRFGPMTRPEPRSTPSASGKGHGTGSGKGHGTGNGKGQVPPAPSPSAAPSHGKGKPSSADGPAAGPAASPAASPASHGKPAPPAHQHP
jgi:hypothetical protein